MVGLLGCKSTLVAHVQLFIHQYPQVLLRRAYLKPFIHQPVLIVTVIWRGDKWKVIGLWL